MVIFFCRKSRAKALSLVSMEKVTLEWLASIDALKDVPGEQLQWLIDQSELRQIPRGELIIEKDKPITGTYIIRSGRIRIYQLQQGGIREVAIQGPNSISGYLPFSRGLIASNYGEAMDDTEVLHFPVEKIIELIHQHYELTQALVHIMTNRVRDYTALQQQNEKMMALGKLSAGLAHELNNPATAVVRGAVSLKEHLQLMPDTFKQISSIQMSEASVETVNRLLFHIIGQGEKPVLTMMQRSSKEDEILDWLDAHNVRNSQEIAENFVDFGFTISHLEQFREHIADQHISAVFNWINSNLVTERIVTDIEEASRRIATLVGSVKSFTHMDQGHQKQPADIHTGIRNTLNILQHKLRKCNITVIEEYDEAMPQVNVMVGEMNQVWVNLIDNAVDAMGYGGTLRIHTEKDGDCARISIMDNGPGIPQEIQTRVFEPFFTTKEIGKGTGLGLDIVHQIISQHQGTIKLASVPGETRFTVSVPING